MTKVDTVFSGSIPSIYDSYLGPLIFEPYAQDLADRLSALNAERVLETATGTGIVTRALLRSLPASVSVVATDLNQPMLDRAAEQVSSTRVSWQKADAQALPFPDERQRCCYRSEPAHARPCRRTGLVNPCELAES